MFAHQLKVGTSRKASRYVGSPIVVRPMGWNEAGITMSESGRVESHVTPQGSAKASAPAQAIAVGYG